MPTWIRNTLFGIVMLCSMIIGTRVYLEIDNAPPHDNGLPQVGHLQSAPGELPLFQLHDTRGELRSIDEWSGQALLINFWATWCAPCREEIPLLQDLHTRESQTGIQVIGIAVDKLEDVELFLAEYGVTYPNLIGEAEAVQISSLFGLDGLGLPFSVLSAADGKVLTVYVGKIDGTQLARLVQVSQAYAAGDLPLATARSQLADL